MYNYKFRTENYCIEQKIIGLCEERGYEWHKAGRNVFVHGVDEEIRNIIEVRTDSFWDLDN